MYIETATLAYLVRILSLRHARLVEVLAMSFICWWQNSRQSRSKGSICRNAADTKIGTTLPASSTQKTVVKIWEETIQLKSRGWVGKCTWKTVTFIKRSNWFCCTFVYNTDVNNISKELYTNANDLYPITTDTCRWNVQSTQWWLNML